MISNIATVSRCLTLGMLSLQDLLYLTGVAHNRGGEGGEQQAFSSSCGIAVLNKQITGI